MKLTPRAILAAALIGFAIYAFPGYIGWDTQAHLVMARSGHYTDAHPPIIAALWRLVELVVTGPLGMMLIQAVSLLAGLYLILGRVLRPRPAAIAAAAIFVFPPICGVTALVVKDALMAGFVLLGIGLLLRGRRNWAIAMLVLGTAMRWNALAATFTPVVFLVRWGAIAGWRRYALATVTWIAITMASMLLNSALTDDHLYSWYGTHAYMDIGGTLRWVDIDDAETAKLLDGLPLVHRDRLHQRLVALYNPIDYRQLQKWDDYLFELPQTQPERDAIFRAWKAVVFGYPSAYLHYRWENFRSLLRLDPVESYSQVYVWFHVIAEDDSVLVLDHDADPSKLQAYLRGWSISLSNTWVYYPYLYLGLLILVLALARDRLTIGLLLSGLGYELAWFFLDPTADFRYSQWMIVVTAIGAVRVVARRLAPGWEDPQQPAIT